MDELILYHASKFGIDGDISPISRDICDFGKGFYMESLKSQALTLICNYPDSKIYTLSFDINNLKVLNFDIDIEWALFIAFNRGKMESIRNTKLYKHYEDMVNNYDVIIGYIVNDKMFITLDRFFNGEITDEVLIHTLSVLNLGKQYVLKTIKACGQVKIINEEGISTKQRNALKIESEKNRNDAISLTEKVGMEYRRVGKYFDEILKERLDNE